MKTKLLFLIICLAPFAIKAQSSSNSCAAADGATHITSGTYTITSFDGIAPDPVCSSGSVASNGEWFAYTPTSDYQVIVSSDIQGNDGVDTRLQVYSGDCGSLNFECLAGSDDDGTDVNGQLSVVQFNVKAGETYYIAWDNRYDSSGFDFVIIEKNLLPISFDIASISTGGTFRGVVDMNNDNLDDIVSIVATNIDNTNFYNLNIQHQLGNGNFSDNDYTVLAEFSASWSLAAGDYNGDGYNDLVFGNGSGVNIVKATNNGTSYALVESRTGVFTQRTNFVDIDEDGRLDIFVCHDIAPNIYFLNDVDNGLTYYQGAEANGVPEGSPFESNG